MNKLLLIAALIISLASAAQGTETIVIAKNNSELFRGTSQEVNNWLLYMDSDKNWYLANITVPDNEAKEWFEKRKDSDNIFKGFIENGMYPTMSLSKKNEPETLLQFYVKYEREGSKIRAIILTSIGDGNNYVFERR